MQGWMFFHLQSTLRVSFSEQSADRCWRSFLGVPVVKQVCPSLTNLFPHIYLLLLLYLAVPFLPCETFCFHLPHGYILWSLEGVQLAQGGPEM